MCEERVTTCKTYKRCVRERVAEWKQPLFGSTGRSRHKKLICAITFSCGGRGLGMTDSNDKHYQRTQDDYSNTMKKQRGQYKILISYSVYHQKKKKVTPYGKWSQTYNRINRGPKTAIR